jgi:hypothetical protein
MTNEITRAMRCRNYAEELRIIAADKLIPENNQKLLRIAASYEEMAKALEAIYEVRHTSPSGR